MGMRYVRKEDEALIDGVQRELTRERLEKGASPKVSTGDAVSEILRRAGLKK